MTVSDGVPTRPCSSARHWVESGPQGALALTRERYPVRLHVVAPGEWGPALQRTTGSAAP